MKYLVTHFGTTASRSDRAMATRRPTIFGLSIVVIVGLLASITLAVPDFQDAAPVDGSVLFNDSLLLASRRLPTVGHNFTDFLRIRDVMNVFGVDHIASVWPQLEARLNANCSQDLMDYLQGLEAGKMWAMQSRFLSKSSLNLKI